MGILGNLLTRATSGGVAEVADAAGGLALNIRSAITGEANPEVEAKIEAEIAKFQGQVNLAEAQSSSPMARTWRPALGWVCVLAMGYHYLIAPLVSGIAKIDMPAVQVDALYPLLLGMLGLGGMRSFEKFKKVQNRH